MKKCKEDPKKKPPSKENRNMHRLFLMLKNSNSHYNIMANTLILVQTLTSISPKFHILILFHSPKTLYSHAHILSQKRLFSHKHWALMSFFHIFHEKPPVIMPIFGQINVSSARLDYIVGQKSHMMPYFFQFYRKKSLLS